MGFSYDYNTIESSLTVAEVIALISDMEKRFGIEGIGEGVNIIGETIDNVP